MRIFIQEMFSYLCHKPGTGQGISRTSAISVQQSAISKNKNLSNLVDKD
jgi:hypothetical protein